MCTADGRMFGSVAEALRMANATMDYLNGPAGDDLDAGAEVRQMRLLRDHPAMAGALADADISKSQALAIAEWTKKLPAELRAETITILVQAAQAGASLDDL